MLNLIYDLRSATMDELIKTIAEVERLKGSNVIPIEALEAAMLTAARKKKGLMADLEAQFDEETGEIHVIEFKTVVENVENLTSRSRSMTRWRSRMTQTFRWAIRSAGCCRPRSSVASLLRPQSR